MSLPFSQCLNLEAEKIMDFKLCYQIDNFRQTKSRKQSFSDGFHASENQN